MKPLLFRVFDGICAVAAEPAPVQDHLAFVYERCRIAGDSPPSVFFEFTGFPTGLCRVVADGEVLVRDEPLVSALLTLDLEILRRPLLLRPGLAGFHAAWVARGDVAFLLVGPGGCGKSTLAWELASRGFHYGSDEVAAFAAADGRLLPFPRKILLRPDNPLIPVRGIQQSPLNLFASLDGRYYTLPPGVAVAGPGVYEANFFFLQYADQPGLKAKPLNTLRALQKLFSACFRLNRVSPALFKNLVQALGPERAFELRYSSVSEAVAFIEQF